MQTKVPEPVYPRGPLNMLRCFGLTYRHICRMHFDPLRFASENTWKYGDVSTYMLLTKRAYVVSHPDLIHEVLVKQSKSFRKLPRQMNILRRVVGNSLLTSEGEVWLRQRRLLQRAFRPSMMQREARIALDLCESAIDRWPSCGEINIGDEMSKLTMSLAIKSSFDLDPGDQADRLAAAILNMSEALVKEMEFVTTLPDWLPLRSKRRRRESLATIDRFMEQAISERRGNAIGRSDLLSLLLSAMDTEGDGKGMSEALARDEALTMMVAGNHTTSATLSWVWTMLTRHPQVMQQVTNEVDDVTGGERVSLEHFSQLCYTKQVIDETLRLYPSAWVLFAREALENVDLGRFRVRKGGWMFMYPFVTHRDARFFEDPLRFDPDRFSIDRKSEIPDHAYFPFGMGPHICIGNRLATLQMTMILAQVLQRFTVSSAEAHPTSVEIVRDMAIRPQGGCRVLIQERNKAASLDHVGVLRRFSLKNQPAEDESKFQNEI